MDNGGWSRTFVVSTFPGWKDVDAWYTQLQSDRAQPTPEIRAKAEELAKAAKSDDEKVPAPIRFCFDANPLHRN